MSFAGAATAATRLPSMMLFGAARAATDEDAGGAPPSQADTVVDVRCEP